MHFRVGISVSLRGILTKFAIGSERVTIAYPDKGTTQYGLNYYPLKIGALGLSSYMPPDQLPFDDVNHVTTIAEDFMCSHRNKSCRIKYDNTFVKNGAFTLVFADGEKRTCKSKKWSASTLSEYLETKKGTDIVARGILQYIINTKTDSFHREVYFNASHLRKVDEYVFVVVFPDQSFMHYSARLFI